MMDDNPVFPDDFETVIERIAAGSATPADIEYLRLALLGDLQTTLQLGKYNVNVGQGQNIQIGDKFYLEWTDEAMQALIQTIRSQISNSFQLESIPQNLPRSGAIEFVGRDTVLLSLHQYLQRTSQNNIVAITGMGGIGKTELALQYTLNYQQMYPGGICWLQGRGVDLGTQIVSYAKTQLKLSPPDDLDSPGQAAFCWRQWLPGDVLVIVDDVVDYSAIKPYLPPLQPRFKILLTSRIRPGRSVQPLPLDVLDEAAALKLLMVLIGNERLQLELINAKALCSWLGYLPLGLEIVGRYLDQRPDLSLTEMQQRLEAKRLDAQALCKWDADMTASMGVASAFELSWETLPAPGRQLGCLLSLFAAASIPWSLVTACIPDDDPEDLEDLRDETLLKLSLLQRIGQQLYQLHPLMREFFQMKLLQLTFSDDLKFSFCRAMVAAAEDIPESLTRDYAAELTPKIHHIAKAATTWNSFLSDSDLLKPFRGLGRFYEGQGFYDQAEIWYKQCNSLCVDRFGANHASVATSLNDLAYIYQCQGRYPEAEPLCVEALEMRKSLLGDEHPEVADSLNDIAMLYDSLGRYEIAESMHKQALEIRIRLLGDKHPDVADSFNNLALLYDNQGRHAEAEPLHTQALSLRKQLSGAKHPRVATSLNNLAYCYSSQGRYADAEPLYTEALALSKQLLGDQHPEIATGCNNLAYLYVSQERYTEAEPLFVQALELNRKLLGEEHPNVATGLNNLASLYDMQGRSLEAEQLYLQAISIRKHVLGDQHPNVAISLNNLAKLYSLQKRFSEAEPLYLQALAILEPQFGANHPVVEKVRSNYEKLLEDLLGRTN